ncbi:MAG: hypothetical protein KIT84_06130 [Labilithrix sp.]|nr:hypothetical protein [Labilithrix sp.]MCW5810569.1 hypothetical protein [Labilithrix sp.]
MTSWLRSGRYLLVVLALLGLSLALAVGCAQIATDDPGESASEVNRGRPDLDDEEYDGYGGYGGYGGGWYGGYGGGGGGGYGGGWYGANE